MESHERIISIVTQKGPVIPAQIATELKINQLFSSAMLSELVDSGKLKISSVKVGGSPLYYLSGQEEQLEKYHTNLPEKEQRAFNLLKQKKILADFELEPLYRVTIRQIKDFAKPLQVQVKEDNLIFWKWHLLSSQETEQLIREKLDEIYPDEKSAKPSIPMVQLKQNEKEPEKQSVLQNQTANHHPIFQKKEESKQRKRTEKENTLETNFMEKLNKHFAKNNITIVEAIIVKKNTDMEFILKIPSPVGELNYFCKAKNKQRCNDADLSSAYVKGEMKKLPVLFITTGDFTKKAQEALQNEFKNLATQIL